MKIKKIVIFISVLLLAYPSFSQNTQRNYAEIAKIKKKAELLYNQTDFAGAEIEYKKIIEIDSLDVETLFSWVW